MALHCDFKSILLNTQHTEHSNMFKTHIYFCFAAAVPIARILNMFFAFQTKIDNTINKLVMTRFFSVSQSSTCATIWMRRFPFTFSTRWSSSNNSNRTTVKKKNEKRPSECWPTVLPGRYWCQQRIEALKDFQFRDWIEVEQKLLCSSSSQIEITASRSILFGEIYTHTVSL